MYDNTSKVPMKVCSKCRESKPRTLEFFYKKNDSLDGMMRHCKKCHSELTKRWAQNNKERFAEIQYKHKEANREQINARQREINATVEGKKRRAEIDKKYKERNKEKVRERSYAWRKKNPDKTAAIDSRSKKNNRKTVNERNRRYTKLKRRTDPQYAMSERLRARMRLLLIGKLKSVPTMELVGCSAEQLTKHLESQFLLGMSWGNRDQWHIDHIVPCASFDLTDLDQQKQCFHYTNLIPLWASDNIRKGDKVPNNHQMAFPL